MSSDQAAGPRIEALEPDSGPAGEAYPITVRIRGGPFDREGNVVRFGPAVIRGVPSVDGTSLVVAVPKSVASGGEPPPMVLPPGDYDVVVETSRGRSEAAVFTLTGGS